MDKKDVLLIMTGSDATLVQTIKPFFSTNRTTFYLNDASQKIHHRIGTCLIKEELVETIHEEIIGEDQIKKYKLKT